VTRLVVGRLPINKEILFGGLPGFSHYVRCEDKEKWLFPCGYVPADAQYYMRNRGYNTEASNLDFVGGVWAWRLCYRKCRFRE
jgi:hypothetical protein